jgi:hypothetical protein
MTELECSCAGYACEECANKYERQCEACFTNGAPTKTPTNFTKTPTVNEHVHLVNGKEQCFCDDEKQRYAGHLPGGIRCRIGL